MEPPANSPTPPAAPPPISHIDPIMRTPGSDMLEAGERLLAIVRRHPIGIIFIYIEALAGVAALIALMVTVSPDAIRNFSSGSTTLVMAAIVFGIAALVFFLFVATYVYRQSRFLITDRGLVEITQTSLFIRKVTRLSFSNVEDVSAEQRGILPTIFNYGSLQVQTAGTMDNFEFKYCPNPTRYADIVIEAREAYAQSLKEENERR